LINTTFPFKLSLFTIPSSFATTKFGNGFPVTSLILAWLKESASILPGLVSVGQMKKWRHGIKRREDIAS